MSNTHSSASSRRGFTLVELSIVLVIIGLIIGGVLVGQDMIHDAQIRATISDLQKTETAIYTFRTKYNAIPGDMPNATSYFAGVVNGDGNGRITDSINYENLSAWQELSLANLVPGNYSGGFVAVVDYEGGTNIPKLRLRNTVMNFLGSDSGSAAVATLDIGCNASNCLEAIAIAAGRIGLDGGGAAIVPYLAAFLPEEVWKIDSKMDDTVATTGRVRGIVYDASTVIAAEGCNTYNLTSTTFDCSLGYIIAY